MNASPLALAVAVIFTFLGLVHVYWALGGRLGLQAALPQLPVQPGKPQMANAFDPRRGTTLAVAAVLISVGAAVGLRGGLFSAPVQHGALQAVLAGVALVMFARAVGDFRLVGFFKRVKGSAFARMDSWVYSPLCVALGLGVGWTAIS
ncbi:Protein of unknown function [Polaromonas sp. YR568]|uniref:DUF3995 domain-containing protein n=1 Tax=Polaromonas sp. YR568 TaxID=1855301 RepID=UPI0008E6A9A3|nr:DUF3995 domain-containing protein [Polaromonas sp. YR568]SFU40613.1 Protein of unknown function [Polaromonas sp. YR568]